MVVRTPIGARFSAHSTAIGKAVLAYLPERELDAILVSNGLTRHTPFTLARMSDLKENLAQVRHRQFSVDNQERERGLSGVAAPILSPEGRLIAAVGMAGPTLRFRGGELRQKISLVRATATRIAASFASSSVWW
jgi:DNA-binding IclR family transcriptional regulator